MMFSKKYFFPLGLLMAAVLFLTPSCGKKAPPLAPIIEGNILAAPENLVFSLEGNQLTLTWTHTIDPVNAKLAPEAFEVYMAVKEIDACEGCPFVFESTGIVPMPDMVYRRGLNRGVHYYFRVQAIGKNEIKSSFSKTSYLDFTK